MTISFQTFWNWLILHPNCILRGGTPDAVLYDDEDLHWHFGEYEEVMVIQVMRGKRVLGEVFLDPERVTYVQELPPENEEEHVFELILETEKDRYPAYLFVLVHGYDELPEEGRRRVH
ncbi:MAG: hypothetical protein P8020_10615 [Acidobacteriota bacterium]|jgi:hypothetical protein